VLGLNEARLGWPTRLVAATSSSTATTACISPRATLRLRLRGPYMLGWLSLLRLWMFHGGVRNECRYDFFGSMGVDSVGRNAVGKLELQNIGS
jgi:hypothetical protein